MTTGFQTQYYTDADWSLIPFHMWGAVERYIMHGIPPGSFLTAVLCNDLREAFARADEENARTMHGWVKFMYNFMPSAAHGSPDQVAAWCNHRGMEARDQ